MDLNALYEMIGTLGFPVCMVVYFIWDKTKITNQLANAIENNNIILTRLLDKMNESELADKVAHHE